MIPKSDLQPDKKYLVKSADFDWLVMFWISQDNRFVQTECPDCSPAEIYYEEALRIENLPD